MPNTEHMFKKLTDHDHRSDECHNLHCRFKGNITKYKTVTINNIPNLFMQDPQVKKDPDI